MWWEEYLTLSVARRLGLLRRISPSLGAPAWPDIYLGSHQVEISSGSSCALPRVLTCCSKCPLATIVALHMLSDFSVNYDMPQHVAPQNHNRQAPAYLPTQTTSHAYKHSPERPVMQAGSVKHDGTGTQFPMQAYAHIHEQSHEHPHPYGSQVPELSPELIAAITRAVGQHNPAHPSLVLPARRYFSRTITNTTRKLPIAVIKELKAGFKNYIPLALCTHRACLNATRYTDPLETEIGWSDQGEMRLKQRAMTAAKDHHLMTDDFTKARENFVCGMRRYLVLADLEGEVGSGEARASECADMFADFFSIIAARPDYMQDWPSYRGYIIKSYTLWVGRRDDSYGLIFDEHGFYKHKMTHLIPVLLDQLHQPLLGQGTSGGIRGGSGVQGQGQGFPSGRPSYPGRNRFHNQFFPAPQRASSSFQCYLCRGAHFHKDH